MFSKQQIKVILSHVPWPRSFLFEAELSFPPVELPTLQVYSTLKKEETKLPELCMTPSRNQVYSTIDLHRVWSQILFLDVVRGDTLPLIW
jgi:hypothetical protein